MNKQEQLRKIAEEIRECSLCKEGGSGTAVTGEGNPDAPVMFVGEAPGREESKAGRPFIGRSGKFLRLMFSDIGLAEKDIFITSPVHYLPVRGTPSPSMINHGRIHLLKQIQVIQPRILVLLGNTACRALLDKPVEILKEHGRTIEKDKQILLITFHPAYAMRFPFGKTNFIQDFAKLKTLLDRMKNPETTTGR